MQLIQPAPCPIFSRSGSRPYSVPTVLLGRVHLRGEDFVARDSRVLVVGDGEDAVRLGLQLFEQNEVCLLTSRSDLGHLAMDLRFLLLELVAEGELELRREARIRRLAKTADGGCEVHFAGGADRRDRFDQVIDHSQDLFRSCRSDPDFVRRFVA